jgi:hypothetical protein
LAKNVAKKTKAVVVWRKLAGKWVKIGLPVKILRAA